MKEIHADANLKQAAEEHLVRYGGDLFENLFTSKMLKMEFIRGCPGVPGGARQNGGRDVETEPNHNQPHKWLLNQLRN